jgi:hypothetical protein
VTAPEPGRSDGAANEEELWRSIVENYGDRPDLPDLPLDQPAAPSRPPADEPADEWGEHFVPPEPPPLPRPDPPVLVAWLGVLGAPLMLMVVVVFAIGIPMLLGLLLAVWFLGGFAYLVSAMPTEPRDPGDDGAQL